MGAMNLLDTFLCIGVPLLLLPLLLFSSPMRYMIMEDLGPWFSHANTIDGFLCNVAPIIIAAVMSIIFTFLSCYNIWHSKPEHMLANGDATIRQQRRMLSAFQRWRYTLISLITVCSVTYGAIWVTLPYIDATFEPSDDPRWYAVIGLVVNKNRYKEFGVMRRLGVEEIGEIRNIVIGLYTTPCIGIQLFLVFGLISEMRATYIEWIYAVTNSITGLPTYVLAAWRFVGRLKLRNDEPRANSYNFTTFHPDDIVLEELSAPSNFATHSASINLIGGRGLPPLPTTPAPLPYSLKYSQSAPIHSSRIYRKESLPRDHHSNPPPESSRSPKARPTPTQLNHAPPRRKPLR
ncbi:hypothetical protein FRC17_002578 [Serendipita sp. 399]|nr:hypothetical protein FRC17_002578 [Serendipita sp. 399]